MSDYSEWSDFDDNFPDFDWDKDCPTEAWEDALFDNPWEEDEDE